MDRVLVLLLQCKRSVIIFTPCVPPSIPWLPPVLLRGFAELTSSLQSKFLPVLVQFTASREKHLTILTGLTFHSHDSTAPLSLTFQGTCLTSHLSGQSFSVYAIDAFWSLDLLISWGPTASSWELFPLYCSALPDICWWLPNVRPLCSLLLKISPNPYIRCSHSWLLDFSESVWGVLLKDKLECVTPLFRTHRHCPPTPVVHLNPSQHSYKTLHDWLTLSFPLLLTWPTPLQPHTAPFWPGTVPDLLLSQRSCTSVHLPGLLFPPGYSLWTLFRVPLWVIASWPLCLDFYVFPLSTSPSPFLLDVFSLAFSIA